ncbi:MAG: GNAT family N-acetyltransferase [Anaerolineaceae bacterium]|nr:GNAT family N-acetyltransferase [Anaerolineaceae bacterium]
MLFEILLGRDLPEHYIERMNAQRIHEYGVNTKNFANEKQSKFIYLWDDDALKAFGMLKPLTLTCQGQSQAILGIGNIMAIEKGRGHGKSLMTYMMGYLKERNAVGLGFCDRENSGFYRKCGYTVVEGISARFRYRHAQETGDRERLESVPDVLCSSPEFIAWLQSSNEPIEVDVPFW